MTLHAAVVNYKTAGDLGGFLGSWLDHAPSWAGLTVVNVCPNPADETVACDGMARIAATGRAVDYRCYEENVGYARGCNEAVADHPADVYALFNADTRILPGVIEQLHDQLLANDDWGVIGPRQVDDQGRITHGGILGTNTNPVQRGWHRPDSPEFHDIRTDAVSVSGSAYFVKHQCWMDAWTALREVIPDAEGALAPVLLYYEETTCSYLVRSLGWKVVYYGPVKMIHRWHKAISTLRTGESQRIFNESRDLFRKVLDAHGIDHD